MIFFYYENNQARHNLKELCNWWTEIQEANEDEQLAMCRNVSKGKRKKNIEKEKSFSIKYESGICWFR